MIAALKSRDLAALRAAIKKDPKSAKSPRVVVAAAQAAWTDALILLKQHGADLNAIYRGYRPMHALIQENPHAHGGKPGAARLECLTWLLENGADPELEAAWPASRAILVAAFTGVPEYVGLLREHGAKVDGFVHAALGDLKNPDAEFARATTGAGHMTALHCCCASRMRVKGLYGVAKMLLDAGADLKAVAKSWAHEVDATYFAAVSGQIDTFELLLKRGADPNAALVHALWTKTPELRDVALRHGADVNLAQDGGKPVLNQMIRWGRVAETLWLLAQEANPNQPDARGWTAVHQAASRGNARMLKAVLDAGGDRDAHDKDGRTPLDILRLGNVTKALADAMRT